MKHATYPLAKFVFVLEVWNLSSLISLVDLVWLSKYSANSLLGGILYVILLSHGT